MKNISFSIDESQLPAHTPEQFKEWVAYKTGARHDISDENPLADRDLHEFHIYQFKVT